MGSALSSRRIQAPPQHLLAVLEPHERKEIIAFVGGDGGSEVPAWAASSESSRNLLTALAHLEEPTIQALVAANPSTPEHALLDLAVLYPEEFLGNNAFLFEEFFGEAFPSEKRKYIQRLAAYRQAIRGGSPKLRLTVGERAELASAYAKTIWSDYLCRDPVEIVRRRLVECIKRPVSATLREALRADPCPFVQYVIQKEQSHENTDSP